MAAICFLAPSIFACPQPSLDTNEHSANLERYIQTLAALRKRLQSNLFKLLASRDTPRLLVEANCYPVYQSLRDGLHRAGLGEIYQPGDVAKIIEQILRDADCCEDVTGIDAFLADPISVSSPMEYVGDSAQKELQENQYIALALGLHMGIFPRDLLWVVGRKSAKNSSTDPKPELLVAATIQDIESYHEELNSSVPFPVDECVSFDESVESICSDVDLCRLSENLTATSLSELIALAWDRSDYAANDDCPHWTIGGSFFQDVIEQNLQNNPIVFRSLMAACVSTIGATEMSKVHPLRTGRGGNNPQVRCRDASAWRRDIDREFHLHYWSRAGSYQFASCGVHGDFSIPDPT